MFTQELERVRDVQFQVPRRNWRNYKRQYLENDAR